MSPPAPNPSSTATDAVERGSVLWFLGWLCLVCLLGFQLWNSMDRNLPDGSGSAEPAEWTGVWPRTVVLPASILGVPREVTLLKPPRRVLLGVTPAIDFALEVLPAESVAALAEQGRVWSGLAEAGDAWLARPTFAKFTAESSLGFEPDLVFCSAFNEPNTTAVLLAEGVPVVPLPYPSSLAEVENQIAFFGRLCGADAAAQRLLANTRRRAAALHEGAERRRHVSVMVLSHGGTAGYTKGHGTLFDDVLGMVGVRNASADLSGDATIQWEGLLDRAPDVILVQRDMRAKDAATAELMQGQLGSVVEVLRGTAALAQLPVVVHGRFVAIDPAAFASTSHTILAAGEQLRDAVDAWLDAGELASPNRDR